MGCLVKVTNFLDRASQSNLAKMHRRARDLISNNPLVHNTWPLQLSPILLEHELIALYPSPNGSRLALLFYNVENCMVWLEVWDEVKGKLGSIDIVAGQSVPFPLVDRVFLPFPNMKPIFLPDSTMLIVGDDGISRWGQVCVVENLDNIAPAPNGMLACTLHYLHDWHRIQSVTFLNNNMVSYVVEHVVGVKMRRVIRVPNPVVNANGAAHRTVASFSPPMTVFAPDINQIETEEDDFLEAPGCSMTVSFVGEFKMLHLLAFTQPYSQFFFHNSMTQFTDTLSVPKDDSMHDLIFSPDGRKLIISYGTDVFQP